jgi:hypothetical protein
MRAFGLALFIVCSVAVSIAAAEDIQLLLPDNNVSSKPILEFRARTPSSDDGKEIGHAYVLLGRELDNGLTLYNAVKGFYPDTDGNVKTITNVIYGPGKVTQTLADAKSEIIFTVYITPLQEVKVVKIIKQWDDKKYSLPLQNCIDMTKAVAIAVGLNIPSMPKDLLPWTFIKALSSQNDKNTPCGLRPREGV